MKQNKKYFDVMIDIKDNNKITSTTGMNKIIFELELCTSSVCPLIS